MIVLARRTMTSEDFLKRAAEEYAALFGGTPPAISKEGGRPVASGLGVSLTHSGDYIAAAIGTGTVGIDLERHRMLDFEGLSRRFFGVPIVSEEAFFKAWTMKEAAAKAHGIPLIQTLRQDDPEARVLPWIEGYTLSVIGKTPLIGMWIF